MYAIQLHVKLQRVYVRNHVIYHAFKNKFLPFKLVLFTEVTLYQSMFFDAGTFRITQERKHSSIVVYSLSRFVAH